MVRIICKIIWRIWRRRSKIPPSTSLPSKTKIRSYQISRRAKLKNNVWKCTKFSIPISRMLNWTNLEILHGMEFRTHFPNTDARPGSFFSITYRLIKSSATKLSHANVMNTFKSSRIISVILPMRLCKICSIRIIRIRLVAPGSNYQISKSAISSKSKLMCLGHNLR